ncbi:hypothetical protein [Rhizobium sp. Root708]|uniref:hypothetical protein n=1 Tax=Rhizobium sp. Root708 TaxID=1736592 RepID=UPI001FCD5597|nr:hypothetical protein [Rhizobium sp. Root708]
MFERLVGTASDDPMGDREETANSSSQKAQRGLWRLMLKLPAIRGRLQIIAAQSTHLNGMFEAYEDAYVALQRFQKERGQNDGPLIKEYETLCSDIESDVLSIILNSTSPL